MTITIILLMLLCIICYTIQSFFNKLYSISYKGPEQAATPIFSSVYGIICGAATLIFGHFVFQPSPVTWIFGLINGVVLFVYNLSMIKASRTGPYAFQSIMMLFGNILLTLLFSTIWWKDTLTILNLVGIFLMLASFVLFNLKGLNFEGRKKGYFMWIAILFTSNGIYGILLDSQQRICLQTERNEMVIITFVSSAAISLVFLAITQKGHLLKPFKMGKKCWYFSLGSSIGAVIAVNLLMYLLGFVQSSILYTINNGCILILSAILCAIVLHEKIEKNMMLGIGVAIISLILLGT